MNKVILALSGIIGVVATFLAISFLFSWPVYMLWNGCLVGAVAGVASVTWMQAWGITVLCSFLFGNYSSKL